jgi:hypothetical protein
MIDDIFEVEFGDKIESVGTTSVSNALLTTDISDGAFRTEMLLRMFAYGKKNISFPSLATLARCRKTTKRTVQRHLDELIKNKRIIKKHIFSDKKEIIGLTFLIEKVSENCAIEHIGVVKNMTQGGDINQHLDSKRVVTEISSPCDANVIYNNTNNNNTIVPANYDADSTFIKKENNKKEKDTVTTDKKKSVCDDAINLTGIFASNVLKFKPDFRELQNGHSERTMTRWSKEIDLLISKDKVSPERIKEALNYLREAKDSKEKFHWGRVVLSGGTLREKFDKIEIAMNRPQNNTKSLAERNHEAGEAWLKYKMQQRGE